MMPPIIILKYVSPYSLVSEVAPHKSIIVPVKVTEIRLINTVATVTKSTPVKTILLASFLFFCPYLLATRAAIATLAAKQIASPKNLGWAVMPTPATAFSPSTLTMYESIRAVREKNTASKIAGQAMFSIVLNNFLFSSSIILIPLECINYSLDLLG